MIKYIGSKRTLLPLITAAVNAASGQRPCRVLDLFSGTARVGHALKAAGFAVTSNDHNAYAACLARCYVETDLQAVEQDARRLIRELSGLAPVEGYITETYCHKSRFFKPMNGAKIDAIRERIAELSLEPRLESVLLVSLMEAADRVDSTTGVQMAYLKSYAPRASNPLELRMPALLPRAEAGPGLATMLDATDCAAKYPADVAYIDPPYNQHKYLGNYHIWETLVRWDKPEVYGRACKRVDCRSRFSLYNSRSTALTALSRLVDSVKAPVLVVSFSDEGFVPKAAVEKMLEQRGPVTVLGTDYPRYIGAQIGIHSPAGVAVGAVSHLRNTEYLFIAGADPEQILASDQLRSCLLPAELCDGAGAGGEILSSGPPPPDLLRQAQDFAS